MKKCQYSKCSNYYKPNSNRQLFCQLRCQWKNRDELHPEYKTKQNQKPEIKLYKRLWKEKKHFDGNFSLIGENCDLCNSKHQLVIHHKDGNNGRNGKSLNNSPHNLIVLCRSCHPKFHNRWGVKEEIHADWSL